MFTNRSLIHTLSAVAVGFLAYQYYVNVGSKASTPFVVVNVAGKGKGVVATRNIMVCVWFECQWCVSELMWDLFSKES